MTCFDFRDWKATRDNTPGPDTPTLRIDGLCTCSRDGHVVTLEVDNEGVFDEPDVQVFRVNVQQPDFGPDVVTDERIHYEGSADPRAKRVLIRLPGEEPTSVNIEDVS